MHLCRNRHLTPSHPPHLLPSTGIGSPAPTSVTGTPATLTPTLGLLSKGLYNPAAVLPPKVAKKILDLEFVEMSEISLDDPPSHTPGQPPLLARPPVQNISVWVEKFSVMAALLASRFPEKAPELFAYQASVVRAEHNFDYRRWVAYDRCYCREALAKKNLDWSVPNARLYNEAFTGHARDHFASRRTTSPRPARGTPTDPGSAGSPPHLTPSRLPSPLAWHSRRSAAAVIMTASVSCLRTPATTHTVARNVEAPPPVAMPPRGPPGQLCTSPLPYLPAPATSPPGSTPTGHNHYGPQFPPVCRPTRLVTGMPTHDKNCLSHIVT